jgi:hypothetical protein
LVEEIIEFFIDYNKLRDRKFKPGSVVKPGKTHDLVKAGVKQFHRKQP